MLRLLTGHLLSVSNQATSPDHWQVSAQFCTVWHELLPQHRLTYYFYLFICYYNITQNNIHYWYYFLSAKFLLPHIVRWFIHCSQNAYWVVSFSLYLSTYQRLQLGNSSNLQMFVLYKSILTVYHLDSASLQYSLKNNKSTKRFVLKPNWSLWPANSIGCLDPSWASTCLFQPELSSCLWQSNTSLKIKRRKNKRTSPSKRRTLVRLATYTSKHSYRALCHAIWVNCLDVTFRYRWLRGWVGILPLSDSGHLQQFSVDLSATWGA